MRGYQLTSQTLSGSSRISDSFCTFFSKAMRTVRVAHARSPGNQNINQPVTLEREHRTVNHNKSVPVLRMLFAYSHQRVKYPQSVYPLLEV